MSPWSPHLEEASYPGHMFKEHPVQGKLHSKVAKKKKMGLPVLWASLGPEQEQQVARLPHPPKQPTRAHFLQGVCGGRGETPVSDGHTPGSWGSSRQSPCWTTGGLS